MASATDVRARLAHGGNWGAVALLGGFGSLWLILQLMGTHYVLNDLRWMIVASVFVAQLLLWNVDWGGNQGWDGSEWLKKLRRRHRIMCFGAP